MLPSGRVGGRLPLIFICILYFFRLLISPERILHLARTGWRQNPKHPPNLWVNRCPTTTRRASPRQTTEDYATLVDGLMAVLKVCSRQRKTCGNWAFDSRILGQAAMYCTTRLLRYVLCVISGICAVSARNSQSADIEQTSGLWTVALFS